MVLSAAGEIGAEISGSQCAHRSQAWQLSQMLGQEVEEKGEIAPIGRNRMGGGAALARQPGGPQPDSSTQIVSGREPRQRQRFRQWRETGLVWRYRPRSSHWAMVISRARARKVNSSVPRPG